MADHTYGFGFSPLSVKNRENGFDEEMVAVKECGMFGIIDTDKHIFSDDYFVRSKAQCDKFVDWLMDHNILGKVYKINVDTNLARAVSGNDESILDTEITFSKELDNLESINGFIFNFDIDMINKEASDILHNNEVQVSVLYKLCKGEDVLECTTDPETPSVFNNKIFDFLPSGETLDKLVITGIKIIKPLEFDDTKQSIILHDILICITTGR